MLRRRVTFHGSVPEGYKLRKILIGLVFLFLPAVAAAQTATVLANAPIYVTPVVTQSPLRVAAAGTTLQVLDDQGEWAKIAYNDPQWGRRIGWVQRSTIKIKDEALQPMDLSLPSAVQSEQVAVAQVPAPQAPGYAPPRPQQPAFLKNHIVGRSGGTFGTTPAALAGAEFSGDVHPLVQVYGSFDWHKDASPSYFSIVGDVVSLVTGVDDVKYTAPAYVGMGGVKVIAPPHMVVRPYGLGGFGVGYSKV
jgi:hypothetical protein